MRLFIKFSVLASISLVLGIVVFIWTLDINQYKPVLIQAVNKLTGRELYIEGDLKLIPSFSPVITAQGVSFSNAPWSSSGVNMLTVGHIEAKASLLPLFSGLIHINQFILHDTRISLETNSDGIGNWVLDTDTDDIATVSSNSNAAATQLPPITIDAINISNADIQYINGVTGTVNRLAINELSTAITDLTAPVTFSVAASYGAFPIELNGTLGPVNTLLADMSYPLDINGRISIFNVQVTGKVEKPLSVEGIDINIAANADTLSDLNQFAGTELPQIAPVALSGNMKFSDLRDIDIEALKVKVGKSDLSGQINYQVTDTLPFITMQLQSELIDVTPFSKETEGKNKPDYLFSRVPLPSGALSLVNLQMSLVAKQMKTRTSEFSNVKIDLSLQDSDVQAVIGSGVAGGTLSGDFSLDTRTDLPPAFNIELTGSGIQLEQLPHDKQKPWFTGGPIDLKVNGSGQGNSMAEFMGGFNGKLLVEVGEAGMPNSNVDLFGADVFMSIFNKLNPFSKSDKTSLLECAVLNFDIRDGITKIDRQIAMQTTKLSMVGSGEINFKTEQLNLGIKPYAREGIGMSLGSITGVAKIGGTLAHPRAEVDAKGVIKAGVTTGAAIATGGLSLLAQGLFNKTTDDPNPCKTALGQSTAAQAQAQPDTGTSTPVENKKGLLDNVKGGFKKLFGN